MPDITVKIGKLETQKRKELVKKLTATASEITSIPESHFVVWLQEHDLECIGVGGIQLSDR